MNGSIEIHSLTFILDNFFLRNTKIGDLAILKLKLDSRHIAMHRMDHSNGLDPINIPDMNIFKKFSGIQSN